MQNYNKMSWSKGSGMLFAVACLLGDSSAVQIAHGQHLMTHVGGRTKLVTEDFNIMNIAN